MTTQSLARMTRSMKKIEKPRPLKISANQNRYSTIDGRLGSFEDIMTLADSVSMHIVNGNYDGMLQMNIVTLSNNLKLYGQQLEAIYKDQLDRAFATFRNGCRDERLDYVSRIHLLEVIEFRATNWQCCDNINLYYKQKISVELELLPVPDTPTLLSMSPTLLGPSASPTTPQPPILSPGEVIKTSGKFAKPTKIPGKNYCKDEVVIRNSDSGKVMGIKGRRVHMIEELSETIISFQRVSPGAKERLVQITGPNENKINDAKHLIEDTIRRNASPVRLEQQERERMGGSSSSLNSSASDDSNRFPQTGVRRSALHHSFSTNDANLGEYKHTVTVGNDSLKVTGTNLELVKTAMLVLEDYFSGEREQYVGAGDFLTTYEEEPRTPSAVLAAPPLTKLTLGSRVGSQDSGATSESEETYKAAPEGHVETGEVGFSENSRLTLVRQPLCPGAPKEAFDKAEASVKAVDQGARSRRAFFAHTNSQPKDSSVIKSEVPTNPLPKRVVYSKNALLHLSNSEFSHAFPMDWDRISKDCQSIVKKSVELFDPAAYIEKCRELGGTTSVVSATEGNLSDPE